MSFMKEPSTQVILEMMAVNMEGGGVSMAGWYSVERNAAKAVIQAEAAVLKGATLADEAAEGALIYRSASGTPTSMTPRTKDAKGLSAANSLENALPGKNQIIDTRKLINLCAVCDNIKTGHVSIMPKNMNQMLDWISSRGGVEVHPLTKELLGAVVGTVNK